MPWVTILRRSRKRRRKEKIADALRRLARLNVRFGHGCMPQNPGTSFSRYNRRMRILAMSGLALSISCAMAQTPADKLIAEGQQSPTLERNLRALTDEIG